MERELEEAEALLDEHRDGAMTKDQRYLRAGALCLLSIAKMLHQWRDQVAAKEGGP